jgi:NAD+ kinase
MSAGGAVVDPRLKCFCVTPICPHSLTSKPLIFPDKAEIEVVNSTKREKRVTLTLDGRQTFDVYYGETVRAVKAQFAAKLIRVKPRSFYQTLRSKLNACDGIK